MIIGRGVFVGAHAIILKGVTIGDRAVVGAGAVVTQDVPARQLAVGNPARILPGLELEIVRPRNPKWSRAIFSPAASMAFNQPLLRWRR